MRTRASAALRVALVLVAASALLRSGPAEAQDADVASTLAGYQGSAAASGVRVLYNPSGLLPIAAPVDLGVPDALATISSGPSTFARSSVADPGDLLANPSALLGLADPSLSGSVPPYPYRVSASSALGQPTAEVSPAPGLNARVKADDSGSSASATTATIEAPAVLNLGGMTASASTAIEGSTVTVHSRTVTAGIDLLGILKIESVVTDLTATSGDGAPKLEGGTLVTGATILGQPVTIDANGIQVPNGSSSSNPLVAAMDDALAQVGIRVFVAEPVDLAGGGSGQLVAAGLRIDVELSERTFPTLGQVLDLIPPMDALIPGLPSVEDILAAARARHLSTIAVGGASVSLRTTSTETSAEPPFTGGGDLPSIAVPTDVGFSLDPITVPEAPSSRRVATSESGDVGFGAGIGGLALLALLLQPLLGDRLGRWATTMLAADGESTCPREARP